jgi:hypothetical protein
VCSLWFCIIFRNAIYFTFYINYFVDGYCALCSLLECKDCFSYSSLFVDGETELTGKKRCIHIQVI